MFLTVITVFQHKVLHYPFGHSTNRRSRIYQYNSRLGQYSIHTWVRRERYAWAWNLNVERDSSRTHDYMHQSSMRKKQKNLSFFLLKFDHKNLPKL